MRAEEETNSCVATARCHPYQWPDLTQKNQWSVRSPAHGQTSFGEFLGHPQVANEDKDPKAILELGAATSWNLSGGAATFAPNLGVEITPVENWLELEA